MSVGLPRKASKESTASLADAAAVAGEDLEEEGWRAPRRRVEAAAAQEGR
jgi:hypothetical protein